MSARGSWWALLAIVLISMGLSSYHAIKVPIVHCPDEETHIDYAFGIYSAGWLLNAGTTPSSGWHVKARTVHWDWERISHRYTLYLAERSGLHFEPKIPPDYHAEGFLRRLDADAPKGKMEVPGLDKTDNPWIITGYPFLYYASVASVMGAVSLFSDSLTLAFFSARFLSVAMLGLMLFLGYACCREMRLSRTKSLIVVGSAGIFPVTSYVASCIQPDNLSAVLVLASFLAAMRIDKKATRGRKLALSGALGLLLVTKYHVFPCVFLPVMAVLLLRRKIRLGEAVLMSIPAVALFCLQLWVVWGGGQLTGHNVRRSTHSLAKGILDAITEYYFGGYAYTSYWSTIYGWPHVPREAALLIQAAVVCMLALTLYYLGRYTARVARTISASGGDPRAYVISPMMIGQICFTSFMIIAFAITDNSFFAQGRHFYPFFIPGILLPVVLAPTVLRDPQTRRAVSGAFLAGLVLFSVLGQIHATAAMLRMYYWSRMAPTS